MREHQLREEAIQSALKNGNYAVCPYGTDNKFIWDWQQDNLIEISSNIDVHQIEINSDEFLKHSNISMEHLSCHEDADSEITNTITLHSFDGFVYGFSTENGTEFFHTDWKDIDWELCGF